VRVEEHHVIGVTGWCLDFAANQKCVLLGQEQLTIVGNGLPTRRVHQCRVRGNAASPAILLDLPNTRARHFPVVKLLQALKLFMRQDGFPTQEELSASHAGQGHSQQTGHNTFVKAVP
jgi:hypothetical protein